MNFAASFDAIARTMAERFGGPFNPATMVSTRPVLDAGGSLASMPTAAPVSMLAQVDAATDAMRRDAGFQDRDVRLILLGDTSPIIGSRVTIASGPAPGSYNVESVTRDPMGVGFDCRARPV